MIKKSVENYNSLANYLLYKQKRLEVFCLLDSNRNYDKQASFISLSAGFHIEGEKHHLFWGTEGT